jgi:iron transport multicopper oxidase
MSKFGQPGTVPGPPIMNVTEGDLVIVNITNRLNIGTGIHWHGMYMRNYTYNDGIPMVSQCVIPPGKTMTYVFTAKPAGTSWWHGHYDNQYGDGLIGPMIIKRPVVELYAPFDAEWLWTINDWYLVSASQMRQQYYIPHWPGKGSLSPVPDYIMVNGVFSDLNYTVHPDWNKVLVRVICASTSSSFVISVDNMILQIVAVDGVDISPALNVREFPINVAQRVDFILDFTSYPFQGNSSISYHIDLVAGNSNFSFRPSPPYPENTTSVLNPNFVGAINFVSPSLPNTSFIPESFRMCPNENDTNLLDARPHDYVLYDVPQTNQITLNVTFYSVAKRQNGIIFGLRDMNGQSGYNNIRDGVEAYTWINESLSGTASAHLNVSNGIDVTMDSKNRIYLSENATLDILLNAGDHPFHFHGHDFAIIKSSGCPDANFSGNYTRRDTVTPPEGGWVLIRVFATNPGVWMFHCHIDWHAETGLAVLFMEGPRSMNYTVVPQAQKAFCVDPSTTPTTAPSATAIGAGSHIEGVTVVGSSIVLACLLSL